MKYPDSAKLTTEALTAANAAVDAATSPHACYVSLWQTLSELAKSTAERGEVDQGRVLWLFADACSLRLDPDHCGDPFVPMISLIGQRSAALSDWSEEEGRFFVTAYPVVKNPLLRARLADLAWHTAMPRHPDYALAAIDAYRQIPITRERWLADGRHCWARAIQVVRMLGTAAASVRIEMESELMNAFFSTGVDDRALPLWIARIAHQQSNLHDQRAAIAERLEALAGQYAIANDLQLAQKFLLMAESLYHEDRNEERSNDMAVKVADLSVAQSHWPPGDGKSTSALAASCLLDEAYQRLRRLPTAYRTRHGLDDRLAQVESWLAEANRRAVNEMTTVQTEGIDVTEFVREAENAVTGLEPADAMFKLVAISPLPSKAVIEAHARESFDEFPMPWFFGCTHFSKDGRVVGKRPPTDPATGDNNALWMATMQQYLFEVEAIARVRVLPALQVIRRAHWLRLEDFVEWARRCPYVPLGRENQVGRGLLAGYNGDYATAVTLLIPQLENMVRAALNFAGHNTQHIDTNGIQTEKSLCRLVDRSFAVEVLGENHAFELKALFCEPIGPNLRNSLAHGLLDDDIAGSLYSLYAWWWILRLVIAGRGVH